MKLIQCWWKVLSSNKFSFTHCCRSLELLRLEKENKHLMKLVESLREGSPRIRELEKQNEELEKNLEEHKSTMEKLAEVS